MDRAKYLEFCNHLHIVQRWGMMPGRDADIFTVMVVSSYAKQPFNRREHWLCHYASEVWECIEPQHYKATLELNALDTLWKVLNRAYPQGLDGVIFH